MALRTCKHWPSIILLLLVGLQIVICHVVETNNQPGCKLQNEAWECGGTPLAQARFGRKGFDPENIVVLVIALVIIFAVIALVYGALCCGGVCCKNNENVSAEDGHDTFDKSVVVHHPEDVDIDIRTINSVNDNITSSLSAKNNSVQDLESLESSSNLDSDALNVNNENGRLPDIKKQSRTIGDHVVELLAVV